jgi:hypothetical protein
MSATLCATIAAIKKFSTSLRSQIYQNNVPSLVKVELIDVLNNSVLVWEGRERSLQPNPAPCPSW